MKTGESTFGGGVGVGDNVGVGVDVISGVGVGDNIGVGDGVNVGGVSVDLDISISQGFLQRCESESFSRLGAEAASDVTMMERQ